MLSAFLLLPLVLGSVGGECVVESHRCDFPFQREEETYYSCMEGDEDGDRYYCISQLGEKYVTGVCNGGCFDEDGSPTMFNSTEGEVMSFFCTTFPSPCKFPFIWEGREYRECTTDGNTEFPWCAIEVDEAGHLVDNRWGTCDMATCDPVSASAKSEELAPEPKKLTITFSELTGSLEFSQLGPEENLEVAGELEGLPEGALLLAVVEGDCDQPLEDISEKLVSIQSLYSDSSSVDAKVWSLSLYPGNQYIIGRSAVIKEQDTPLLNEEGRLELGRVVSCTPIQESSSLDTTLIIIIAVVAIVVLVLVILIVCVVCCCCKRRKRDTKEDYCSIDDPEFIGNGDTKTPLYDELSIPFIDASLPPTPKIGRSTDQLAILLGRGSKASLSNDEV